MNTLCVSGEDTERASESESGGECFMAEILLNFNFIYLFCLPACLLVSERQVVFEETFLIPFFFGTYTERENRKVFPLLVCEIFLKCTNFVHAFTWMVQKYVRVCLCM